MTGDQPAGNIDVTDGGRLRHRFELMTRLLRGWVWETDVDHRYCYLSSSVQSFSSRPPQWYYGRTREELGFQHADDSARAAYHLQLERRERFGPIELKRDEIGKLLWRRSLGEPQFDACGQFIGYCGIAYDITAEVIERERHSQVQAARQHDLDILQTTIDSFPGGICVVDASHDLAFANGRFYGYLGLPPQRFPLGTAVHELFDYMHQRGDFKGDEDEYAYHLRQIETDEQSIYECTRANGTRLAIRAAPLPGGGQVRTYTDVTFRYEHQWRLEHLIHELQSRVWILERGGRMPRSAAGGKLRESTAEQAGRDPLQATALADAAV